jgi:hypothetical protein
MSLAWRGSARSWAAGASRWEAASQFDLYRRYAERATECEKKADAWLAEAFGAMAREWDGVEDREARP